MEESLTASATIVGFVPMCQFMRSHACKCLKLFCTFPAAISYSFVFGQVVSIPFFHTTKSTWTSWDSAFKVISSFPFSFQMMCLYPKFVLCGCLVGQKSASLSSCRTFVFFWNETSSEAIFGGLFKISRICSLERAPGFLVTSDGIEV